jgi:hypothetical protein
MNAESFSRSRPGKLFIRFLVELNTTSPFLESLTTDEMSQKYLHYIGDNDEKALSYMAGKLDVKAYIRSLFIQESV